MVSVWGQYSEEGVRINVGAYAVSRFPAEGGKTKSKCMDCATANVEVVRCNYLILRARLLG